MLDQLCTALDWQAQALTDLERHTRVLELIVADDRQRFIGIAAQQLEQVSEQVAALEVTRAVAMTAAGFPADLSATELVDAAPAEWRDALSRTVEAVRLAADRFETAQERAVALVGGQAAALRSRLAAAEQLAQT